MGPARPSRALAAKVLSLQRCARSLHPPPAPVGVAPAAVREGGGAGNGFPIPRQREASLLDTRHPSAHGKGQRALSWWREEGAWRCCLGNRDHPAPRSEESMQTRSNNGSWPLSPPPYNWPHAPGAAGPLHTPPLTAPGPGGPKAATGRLWALGTLLRGTSQPAGFSGAPPLRLSPLLPLQWRRGETGAARHHVHRGGGPTSWP